MSCDGLHGNISQQINVEKYLYTPQDFIEKIQTSRSNVFTKYLTHKNILIFNHNFKSKAFLIREVKQAQFRKGSHNIYIKTDFDEELRNFDIIDSNFKESLIQSNN
jgi:hypothetical protein